MSSGLDAITRLPHPVNQPSLDYAPGSAERAELEDALGETSGETVELPLTIGGRRRLGSGTRVDVVQPHNHAAALGTFGTAGTGDTTDAIAAARAAAPGWREMAFDDRAAVLLRAADLLAGPWRARMNAATMLGQSKTPVQADIDAACELIDFWRFNAFFARRLLAEQPDSSPGVWNRADYRPLEGFVYAVTPFNFTSIAGNLPTAPALMGNVVLWKPSPTQTLAATLTLRLLESAGLPPGVINLLTGDGVDVSSVALTHPDLAGIHFTGSAATFGRLWSTVGENIAEYRSYPRIVGETGGKDFVLAHPSADVDVLRTALVRGAFEYQGQKCSAASRAYIPRSVWSALKDSLVGETEALAVGNIADFSNFAGAVIDRRAYDKVSGAIAAARARESITVAAGGTYDDSVGYFIRPTILVSTDPHDETFSREYFGPLLSVFVYDDGDWDSILDLVDTASAYGLTGAVVATDRTAIVQATGRLRFTAGNFYINDKPTGAVVGQQPFGGSRGSGTNDKAGSMLNLARWTSPRAIKETFVPPTAIGYPHQES